MESSPPLPTSLPEAPQTSPSGASPTAFHESLSVAWTAAPLHKRVLAYCVDWGILGALSQPVFLLGLLFFTGLVWALMGVLVNQNTTSSNDGFLAQIVVLLLGFVFLLAYLTFIHGYFICHHLKRGATPGKRIFGLKVISLDGRPLSRGQCIRRECLAYIDVGLFFPGLISIMATPRNQRLGDLAAGTMVTHSSETEDQDNYLYITQEEYLMLKDLLTLDPISPHLADEYLKFAYHYFITKQAIPSSDELERWESRARRSLGNAAEHVLDQQSVLLFFAEHCFQTARS